MNNNKLVQTSTSDGLILHGYYVPSKDKRIAVLQVHGLAGNFYEDTFTHIFAQEFEEQSIGYLTANNRGNGKDMDFNKVNGDSVRIGSQYELLEEAHLDITAWLKILIDEGYKEIVLMGHSAGSVKAVRYLFEGELKDKITKLILLSPIDVLGFRLAKGRIDIDGFLKQAQMKVDEGKGNELITSEFDHDTLSYKTFISWYRRDDLGRMFDFFDKDYDFQILKHINIPTKILVGSNDEYFHPSNPSHPQEAMDILLKNISNSKGKTIEGAAHSFKPYENVMVKAVSSFVLD
ncbi:MAG TPA: alpha/beta hydrolase [Candidatus Dojkabacteria bacterium]|nr:alpha/beta hydrolase [Candidatus Dojkabacteria bacterium]